MAKLFVSASPSRFSLVLFYLPLLLAPSVFLLLGSAAGEEQHLRLVVRVEPTFALARTLGAPAFEPPALLFDVPLVVYRLAYTSHLVTLIRVNQTLFASVDTNAKVCLNALGYSVSYDSIAWQSGVQFIRFMIIA